MPPIHTGMSVQVGLPSSVDTYLRQWLKVASGDRVYLFQHTSGMTNSYTVFKCQWCGDNWHVGGENFEGTQIPQTLKDWVNKHRHVCTKYKSSSPDTHMLCLTCKWPYGAHEESWMAKTPTVNDPQDGIDAWEDATNVAGKVKWILPPVKDGDKVSGAVKPGKTLPEFTGRKFRDVEES